MAAFFKRFTIPFHVNLNACCRTDVGTKTTFQLMSHASVYAGTGLGKMLENSDPDYLLLWGVKHNRRRDVARRFVKECRKYNRFVTGSGNSVCAVIMTTWKIGQFPLSQEIGSEPVSGRACGLFHTSRFQEVLNQRVLRVLEACRDSYWPESH